MTATLGEVRAEIALRLQGVDGLDNVYGYVAGTPTPPCAIVGWPERLELGRRIGNVDAWEAVIPVQILVGMGDTQSADANLARFTDPDSIQAVFDTDPTMGGVVAEAVATFVDQFGVAQFAEQGVQYLTCIFNIDVTVT